MTPVPGFKVVRYGPSTFFLGGELDMAVVAEFTEAVEPSVESGGAIVLDLAALTFIDSMGAHAIFELSRRLGDRGCLIIHAPRPRVARVLALVGVEKVSHVHVDVCPADTLPASFLDWRTPSDIDREFEELRRLGGVPTIGP